MILGAVSERVRPDRHEKKDVRLLAYLGLAGLSCFVATVVALHWLQPQLNPVNEVVSYYVHGAWGWLLTVGLIGLGIGSLALTIGVGRAVVGPGVRAGWWLLAIWSIGVLLSGIFAADPPGNWDRPPSRAGMIHGNAALIAILTLPIAALVLARSFRHDLQWRRKGTLLLILAVATVLSMGAFMTSLVPVIVSPGPPWLLGFTERILLGVYVVWLWVLAVGLLQAAGRARPAD